jgi:broad-specificity NMP kinase
LRRIEFLGVPGVGKTTLVSALLSRMGDRAIGLEQAVRISISDHGSDPLTRAAARLTRSPSSRLWRAAYARSSDRFSALVRFLAVRADLVESVLRIQQMREERDVRQDLALGWILNLMARYQLASEGGSEVLVIDEGFCQRAVALFAHGFDVSLDAPLLDAYLDQIPLPELLIWTTATPEVASQRLDGRGWSERMDAERANRDGFLAGAFEVVEMVRTRIADRGIPVIEVDGCEDTPMTVTSLTAEVARRF